MKQNKIRFSTPPILNIFSLKKHKTGTYFVTKLILTYCCSSDRKILLQFEAEGREFAKLLRSLEQFIQTVKGQNNFW